MNEFLWHGSTTQDLKLLKPKREFTPQIEQEEAPAAVYAAKDPAYAAAHALHESTIGTGIDICRRGRFVEGKPEWGPIRLEIPVSMEELLDVPTSVYKLSAASFEYLPDVSPEGENFRSLCAVEVLEEQKFASIRLAVESFGGLVVLKKG